MGYEAKIQVRPGEVLRGTGPTRGWMSTWMEVGRSSSSQGEGRRMALGDPRRGDIAPGRIGNGVLEDDVL